MDRVPDPNPFLLGQDGPELRITGEVALLLLPAVRHWVEEHRRMGAVEKVAYLLPVLQRWEHVATLERDRVAGVYSRESGGAVGDFDSSPSPHAHDEISSSEAAEWLGVTRQWVGALCRRGELDSRKLGGALLVSVASIVAFEERRAA